MSLYIDDMRIEKVEAENSRGSTCEKMQWPTATADTSREHKAGFGAAHAGKGFQPARCRHGTNRLSRYNGQSSESGQEAGQSFLYWTSAVSIRPDNTSSPSVMYNQSLFPIGNDAYLSTAWHTR